MTKKFSERPPISGCRPERDYSEDVGPTKSKGVFVDVIYALSADRKKTNRCVERGLSAWRDSEFARETTWEQFRFPKYYNSGFKIPWAKLYETL